MNLALLHEALAAALAGRECLVFRERRFTWAQVQERTRRLASVLRAAGLGCTRERAALENWESGQDHVALYMQNGNEYLEGMLGAFKARCVPFNVNYRYVAGELSYLLQNARARAVIFHARFAPLLKTLRAELPRVALWLEVDDGSGAHLPGARAYEDALAAATPAPPAELSPDDLYMLYTGGTTGLPKGVLWSQRDILRAALLPRRFAALLSKASAPDARAEIVRAAVAGAGRVRGLPAPPFMHGAAHWAAFSVWHSGGVVFVQDEPRRFDAADIWRLVERERLTLLTIVGDAFARPLLDALQRGRYDLSSLRSISSGGAMLSAATEAALLEALPGVRILDVLGASESGQQGTRVSRRGARASSGDFSRDTESTVLAEDLSRVLSPRADAGAVGWLARTGPMPLGYYRDAEKTARTFPVVNGVRFAVPGDRARLLEDGSLRLLGREAATINSGGEKIFAEEVEHALKRHPSVYDAVVVGVPDPRWGEKVAAVVSLRAGAAARAEELSAACAEVLARYKLPRVFVFVGEVLRGANGKADYRWAREKAGAEALEQAPRGLASE